MLIYKRIMGAIQNSQYFYFISRDDIKDFYLDEEFARFYSAEELQRISKTLFVLEEIYGDFNDNGFEPTKSERMITIWRKVSSQS